MKKLLIFAIVAMFAIVANAQERVLKAGTIVPLKAINEVRAANVNEGEAVDFQVTQDIKVGTNTVIAAGTLVKGVVQEARKSTIAGTKGRLVININQMNLSDGTPVFFSNTAVRIYGKNKTPLAVVTACFVWPCIFIPGTKAVMPAGYEVFATVAANVEING